MSVLTIGLHRLNHTNTITQQLKAAQNRVEKLEQELQTQKPLTQNNEKEQNQPQLQQQQTTNNFDALNHIAAQNLQANPSLQTNQQQGIFDQIKPDNKKDENSKLRSELATARTDVRTNEQLLANVKPADQAQDPKKAELHNNPIFHQLPQELKDRQDIGQLIPSTDSDALLNPDKAVQGLVDQALMGNKKAFTKLSEYSKNQFDLLQNLAGKGMEKVIAGAEGRPKVLEMVASTNTEKAGEAAAKLLNLADRNPRAQQGIEGLLRKGKVNFTKVANDAKNLDPGRTATSINELMKRGNLSKADRKGAVAILGQLAKESPTGTAGQDAVKGLVRAVKSEPLDIAKQAATNLGDASLNGNANAMNGLQKLAKSDDPSRAQLALSQLGKIAMSGTSNATAGLDTIKSVAQDPGANGKTRNFAVETLGKVASAGGGNTKDAVNTLSNIATNKANPSSANAFNVIGKMNNSTLGVTKTASNPKDNSNLSDTETYKKVMATQQQLNGFAQKTPGILNKFAMQFAPAM